MVLFIDAVDELLSEKGLGFVTNIINIAFIVLLAILITKGVRRLMQRLRSSRRISDDPVKQKRAETAETLMASIIKYVTYFIAAALIASELGFGASVRSLLAAAGIGGIVIGIGAQSLISDIVNGFFFLFEARYAGLSYEFSERAEELFAMSECIAKERYEHLLKLVDMYDK